MFVTDTHVSTAVYDLVFGVVVSETLRDALRDGEWITLSPRLARVLEVAQTVCLQETDLVVVLVGVGRLAVVDVPQQQPVARKAGSSSRCSWRFSNEEVLLARWRVLRQAEDLLGRT